MVHTKHSALSFGNGCRPLVFGVAPRSSIECDVIRFRLLTLICVVTVFAVAFTLLPREARVIGELRRDLRFADQNHITIIDRVEPNCILAVVKQEKIFKLFVCYRGFWGSANSDEWEIPFVVGSGAPPGEPEAVIEYSQEFNHFPTNVEISKFRQDYAL